MPESLDPMGVAISTPGGQKIGTLDDAGQMHVAASAVTGLLMEIIKVHGAHPTLTLCGASGSLGAMIHALAEKDPERAREMLQVIGEETPDCCPIGSKGKGAVLRI